MYLAVYRFSIGLLKLRFFCLFPLRYIQTLHADTWKLSRSCIKECLQSAFRFRVLLGLGSGTHATLTACNFVQSVADLIIQYAKVKVNPVDEQMASDCYSALLQFASYCTQTFTK